MKLDDIRYFRKRCASSKWRNSKSTKCPNQSKIRPKITCSSRISFIVQLLIVRNPLGRIASQYEIVPQNSRSRNIQVRFQSNLKVECTESGHFIEEIAILHSRARNSINGTILHTNTGDGIVRMSVMIIDDNIFRPRPHSEDENCICEMHVRSKVFFDGAKEQRSGR